MVKGGLATPEEGRQLLREQVYETLPTDALPEEDDAEPQGEVETARKTGVEAIVALLDGGLVSPEEARDLARRLLPDISEGPPPEPEPEPELIEAPSGNEPEVETAATEEGREAE